MKCLVQTDFLNKSFRGELKPRMRGLVVKDYRAALVHVSRNLFTNNPTITFPTHLVSFSHNFSTQLMFFQHNLQDSVLLFSSALATLSLSIDPESERLECRAEAEAWTQGEEMVKSLQDQGQVRLRLDLICTSVNF